MTQTQRSEQAPRSGANLASWQGAIALAAAMGIGRFVYTPALGAMTAQDAISAEAGALLASANYLGYLVGALLMLIGRRLQQPWPFRIALLILAVTLALMTVPSIGTWFFARTLAGIASAVIFVSVAQAVASRRAEGVDPGIVYAGLGAGVTLTGLVGGLTVSLPWQSQWWVAFGCLVLAMAATWTFDPQPKTVLRVADAAPSGSPAAAPDPRSAAAPSSKPLAIPHPRTSWWLLFLSYGLLGAGYIILGTFLVVQVDAEIGAGLGSWFWVVTGLVAIPSTVIWRSIADRIGPSLAFAFTLVLQTLAGILPVVIGGVTATVIAAALYGFTFISAVMLATGMIHLNVRGAAARLTALYSLGQLAGPLAVLPLVGAGYLGPFLVAAAINGVAMLLAFGLFVSLRRTRRNASDVS
ncbi:MAG: YbfB/YjiJ family MFS transporter [Gulosibacter sp.]|uniref:YbfB/YjiJ family MFS transporter n=1 Tax=Gulosibacter sp. TaxID=2817531 RepID=UPI003F9093D5